ncbi:response regulator transcription factor [Actinomyces oris]|uniref:Response regulator transcription factor n=1 Tax=Actinomyces oris TaxID=544580 RepID=A0AAW9L4C1_9ACTO|nr:response regulator transcription factor [Actinomyces oris]MEA1306091.1 response regulator transcription factor [Actinomyces oris]OLO59204.1 DNA-binding response regulator [Actinomyces oris]OLO68465.1 DNA-binding response regulator [Actinomyces oris]
MTRTLRIALVDDQDLVRSGFRMILDAQKDMCVVGQASDGVGVLPMVKTTQPDIVLMDIRMPTMDGISATHAVLGSHPDLKVLILTTFDLDDYLVAAMRAGASGFLLKDSTAPELLAGIRAVARGDSVVAPSATRRLLKRWFAPTGPAAPSEPGTVHTESIDALSDREKEIVTLVGRAMSNAEIAQHLVLAESTIKSHLNRILHKLELRDRAQLIVLAYESGLVRVGG